MHDNAGTALATGVFAFSSDIRRQYRQKGDSHSQRGGPGISSVPLRAAQSTARFGGVAVFNRTLSAAELAIPACIAHRVGRTKVARRIFAPSPEILPISCLPFSVNHSDPSMNRRRIPECKRTQGRNVPLLHRAFAPHNGKTHGVGINARTTKIVGQSSARR